MSNSIVLLVECALTRKKNKMRHKTDDITVKSKTLEGISLKMIIFGLSYESAQINLLHLSMTFH